MAQQRGPAGFRPPWQRTRTAARRVRARTRAKKALLAAVGSVLLISAYSADYEDVPDVLLGVAATTPDTAVPGDADRKALPEAADAVRLLFTGDMLPSDALREQAGRYAGGQGFDFMPIFADVAPIVAAADWAVCHQETPVSLDNVGLAGYPRFNAPFELAEDQRAAGFDACSTASNHTVDLGLGGIQATLGALDLVGIEHTGSARSYEEFLQARI